MCEKSNVSADYNNNNNSGCFREYGSACVDFGKNVQTFSDYNVLCASRSHYIDTMTVRFDAKERKNSSYITM